MVLLNNIHLSSKLIMKTDIDAYKKIAQSLIASLDSDWDTVVLDTKILDNNCSALSVIQYTNNKQKYLTLPFEAVFDANAAALFLRDEIFEAKGDRIWGLTFILHSDGKFKIEYDYNKPDNVENLTL